MGKNKPTQPMPHSITKDWHATLDNIDDLDTWDIAATKLKATITEIPNNDKNITTLKYSFNSKESLEEFEIETLGH